MSNLVKYGIAAAGTAAVGAIGYYGQKAVRGWWAKRAEKKAAEQKPAEQPAPAPAS